jgi:hypothetical protein
MTKGSCIVITMDKECQRGSKKVRLLLRLRNYKLRVRSNVEVGTGKVNYQDKIELDDWNTVHW